MDSGAFHIFFLLNYSSYSCKFLHIIKFCCCMRFNFIIKYALLTPKLRWTGIYVGLARKREHFIKIEDNFKKKKKLKLLGEREKISKMDYSLFVKTSRWKIIKVTKKRLLISCKCSSTLE